MLDTVLHNFYVDDCLKSVDTLESAIPLAKNVRKLLARRRFRLTKVVSNSLELLNTIPKEEWGKSITTLDLSLDKLPTEPALGMLWDIETHSFHLDVQAADKPKPKSFLTVYDPLGCVSLFVLQARRLFQQLCRLQKDWDEPLPKELEQQWGQWLNDLPVIKNFKIPRCLVPHDKPPEVSSATPLLRCLRVWLWSCCLFVYDLCRWHCFYTTHDGQVKACTIERIHHTPSGVRWCFRSSKGATVAEW